MYILSYVHQYSTVRFCQYQNMMMMMKRDLCKASACGHRRRRWGKGERAPPQKKKIGKFFSGNFYIKIGNFRAKIM